MNFIYTFCAGRNIKCRLAVTEKLFIDKIQEIENNADWFAVIKNKSIQSGFDPDKQVKSDAVWTLHINKQISGEMADALMKKYNL